MKMVESIFLKSNSPIEFQFLGRPEPVGINERNKSLYFEWNGSRFMSGIQPIFPQLQLPVNTDFIWLPWFKDEAFLRQKYQEEQLCTRQIAFLISYARSTVASRLKGFGVELRSEDGAHQLNKGQLGYGERRLQGRTVTHGRECQHIDQITQLRDNGYSYWKIAEILNTMGIPTKSRRAKWQAATVMKIFKAAGSP